jgi:alkylhydroperoxidase/carboxymuconolactone decarboxylase family protein
MKTYYDPEDLKKFGKIGSFGADNLAKDFFKYYGNTMADGALSAREKALIALAVSHALKCPYCIDAYTQETLEKGCSEDEMMEAVHVAATMAAGITLAHSVQMMNKAKELTM